MSRNSLVTQAMLRNTGITVGVVLATAALFLFSAKSAFHQQSTLRARELTQFVASQCDYPLLVNDRAALEMTALKTLEGEDVLYVVIADSSGGPPVALSGAGVAGIPTPPITAAGERVVAAGGLSALEAVRPVMAPKTGGLLEWEGSGTASVGLGTVRIGFSMKRQNAWFSRMALSAAGLTALLLAIVLPLQVRAIRRGLSPLRDLALFTRKVGAGDLSQPAKVIRNDEAGELTAAFNQMIETLRSTTVSRNYVDDILQCMAESLIVVGTDGGIETVNRAALGMLGYTEEELRGRPATLIAPASGGVAPGGASVMSAYRAKSGREIPVLLSSSVLRTRVGEPQGMVWLAQDMTEKMRVQQELVKAKEAAEQASQAKSVFLATMSHELRTPLNAILGFAQLIQAELGDRGISDWDEDLDKIRRAGRQLLRLINDVLDFSKIEAGKIELESEEFDPSAVVRDVTATAEQLAARNGSSIHAECEPALLCGDRMRYEQCLLNLVGNACKFTRDGKVSIEARREERNGRDWYSVRVADTGIGIPPEAMGKLFDDFSQVDASTTRKYGGSGLGLAITRRLARLMGGDVTVESRPEAGSVFTIAIPLNEKGEDKEARRFETERAAAE